MKITGLPPIAPDKPRILILGSMPGNESLRQQQYYAHPRNAFWGIIGQLPGFEDSLDYERRTRFLKQCHIALWDVLKRCERQGSLDSAIKRDSEEANDLVGFLRRHDSIRTVLFNGKKAEQSFSYHILPKLRRSHITGIRFIGLPSSSPKHARLKFEEKCKIWHQELMAPGNVANPATVTQKP